VRVKESPVPTSSQPKAPQASYVVVTVSASDHCPWSTVSVVPIGAAHSNVFPHCSHFSVSKARSEYDAKFRNKGLAAYDEAFGGEVCANCAISQTGSDVNRGRAILMMSGDEDYDDDFVGEWL
jgi:hypothetical protein